MGLAAAQVNPGAPSFSASESHAVDTINLQNLNISLNVPVMSKNGAIPFRFSMLANSYIYKDQTFRWHPSMQNNSPQNDPFAYSVNGLIAINSSAPLFMYSATSTLCPDGHTSTMKFTNWGIGTTDGTLHWLDKTLLSDTAGCYKAGFTGTTIDGSGYTLTVNLGAVQSLYDRAGTKIWQTSLTDSNSNVVSTTSAYSTFTDSLNTTAMTAGLGGAPPFKWTDVNGGSPQSSVTNTTMTLQSAFGCTGISEYNFTGQSMPTGISLPNGTSLSIGYEPLGTTGNYTGRLGQITLPTGGTISYAYSGGTNGIDCTYQVSPTLKRTTSDGTTQYDWARFPNGSGYGNTTTVTDPGGNKTIYTFTGLASAGNAAFPVTQALTQVLHYQGSSTLLTTDVYCYQGYSGQPANCATAVVSLPIQEVDVYHTINGMGSNSSRTQTKYDGYGNVTYSAQYDFGASSATTATTTTYGTWNGSSCVAVSSTVNNKPCDVVTTQGSNTVAESRYAYDASGNLLTTYAWTGSAWLSNTTPNVYNSNGTPSDTYDLANNHTSYSYTGTGGCNNLFPTSVTKGGLTTYSTWDCTGGVKVTDKDANGNITTYGYKDGSGAAEPFWRVSSVTDPLGNKVWKTYAANSSENTLSFGSSVTDVTGYMDGYGISLRKQAREGPTSGTYDTVSSAYGWSGNYRQRQSTMPCAISSGSDCSFTSGVTTSLVDPVGRTFTVTNGGGGVVTKTYAQQDVLSVLSPAPSFDGEHTKSSQNEYDGLGRLKSSCGIEASGGSACGQVNGSYSGVLTSFSYTSASGNQTVSSTRGSQTHSKTVDGLGRVTSSTTPEGGTISNIYDSLPTACNGRAFANPGKLIYSGFANGSSSCYQYDGLGRITAISGVSGSNSLCKRFYYDNSSGVLGAVPSGITLANQYGHMVEAETDTCAWPVTASSIITDEWFSYDVDGHMTDMWESTPHSGQYYHSEATFFANGVVNTLQLASPNLYTVTYGVDGAGRPNTLTSGSTVIVSGTTFNAAGQPTNIAIGSGSDYDAYTYDSSTGRMTGWTFGVGTQSETAVLTWNANGTLNELNITDGFNAGGSQDCKFGASGTMGYDDLGRLLSDNCGSVWAQTFSYDQYDNLTKSGSSSWTPGYSASNNQYTLAGVTYDASGNLTYDTFHTYTWDEFNKLATIDSTACGTHGQCVTYDALGRAVETSNGAAYTEIWYTQLGKTAYMNGSTLKYAYWSGPGGGTLFQPNGNNYWEHKDWLGNARVSSGLGTTIIDDRAFAPYGEMYDNFGSTSANELIFTGDTSNILPSVLYDTENRELNPSQGRWLSPDPAVTGWNQYAYGTDPNTQTDPTGMWITGTSFGLLNEGLRGPFNAAFDVFPGLAQGEYSPVPANECKNCSHASSSSNSGSPSASTGAGDECKGCPVGTVTTVQVDQFGKVVQGSAGMSDTSNNSADLLNAMVFLPKVLEGLSTNQIAVIGKLPDTALWAQRGYNVFQMQGHFYEVQEANSAWMAEVVENGQPIIVGSELTEANLLGDEGLFEEGFSSFGSEVGEFLSAGAEFATTEEAGELLLLLLIP